MHYLTKHFARLLFIFIFIVWTIVLTQVSPEQIVERFGTGNGYLLVFLAAFFGGLSTFVAFPYYLIVFTLGAGGLNPIILGLAAGLGVSLGDSTSYMVGYQGRHILPSNLQAYFQKFCQWCLIHPPWLVSTIVFMYGVIVPFPNDLIVIPLGLARYPFLRLLIPLGLGNVVFNIIVALLGAYSLGS